MKKSLKELRESAERADEIYKRLTAPPAHQEPDGPSRKKTPTEARRDGGDLDVMNHFMPIVISSF